MMERPCIDILINNISRGKKLEDQEETVGESWEDSKKNCLWRLEEKVTFLIW